MSGHDLWELLSNRNLVDGDDPHLDLPSEEDNELTWYIRVLQGVAGWFAAIFLLIFMAFGLEGIFGNPVGAILLGVCSSVPVFFYSRYQQQHDFVINLLMAFSLAGQILVAYGVFDNDLLSNRESFIVFALYEATLAIVIKNFVHRLLSAYASMMTLFWSDSSMLLLQYGVIVIAAVFAITWLLRSRWGRFSEIIEPAAYASLGALLSLTIFEQSSFAYYSMMESGAVELNATMLLFAAILVGVMWKLAQQYRIEMISSRGVLFAAVTLLLLASLLIASYVSCALLIVIIGFYRQNVIILAAGAVALLGFISWYYYHLGVDLFDKSIILMGSGAILLVAAFIMKKRTKEVMDIDNSAPSPRPKQDNGGRRNGVIVAGFVVFALVAVNGSILKKEKVLTDGKTVVLELAPVDPRSIMQGDFMRLRFALASDILAAYRQSQETQSPENNDYNSNDNTEGLALVALDEDGRATFVRFYDENNGDELESNQAVIQFRIRGSQVQFATNAFFFEEGTASIYNAARFGLFKVAENGEMLLHLMLDKDGKVLGENNP